MSESSSSNTHDSETALLQLCKYCSELINPYKKPGILCDGECGRKIHIDCLSQGRVPIALEGDVFFNLLCKECNNDDELISRAKMSWFKAVVLTLYNLQKRSNGISKKGYFHWKSDIVLFIDRNWDNLFQKHVKRKKNWIGTISGTLSHYKDTVFLSGTDELRESGWWKLIDSNPPEILAERNDKAISLRKKLLHSKRECDNLSKTLIKSYDSPVPSESSLSFGEDSNVSSDVCKNQTSLVYSQAYAQPTGILSDFLLTEDDLQDMGSLDIEEEADFEHSNKIYEPSFAELINNIKDEDNLMTDMPEMSYNHMSLVDFGNGSKSNTFEDQSYDYSSDSRCSEDIVSAKKRCSMNYSNKQTSDSKTENMEMDDENHQESETNIENIPPSLFNVSKRRKYPWIKYDLNKQKNDECIPMSIPEELHLLKKIEKYKHKLNTAPSSVRRLYRKLVVRKWKRENNLPILDIDQTGNQSTATYKCEQKNSILDLFMGDNVFTFYEQRLRGYCEPTFIHSPYTDRTLKPFIRRDTESRPLWLNVMQELLDKTNKNNPNRSPEPLAPIDYSYVRPQHIPAMNSLCNLFFWPGIDLTECLQYPDFTCVALYKKLVIGFAVMVPDVGINEAYISFILTRPEWRNAKIGTFMLYHLIQTCMGKDITLHVSTSNPAFFLYKKFGFKINEFVQDFYDKYMSPNSRESRHALFLKLSS